MALERRVTIAQPDILAFHQSVLNSIQKYGRTHKLEIMLRYKPRKRDFLADTGVGLKMLLKGKLHLLPNRIDAVDHIRQMFQQQKAA